jgi:hypothetical protein
MGCQRLSNQGLQLCLTNWMTSKGIYITGANAYQTGCLDSNRLIVCRRYEDRFRLLTKWYPARTRLY